MYLKLIITQNYQIDVTLIIQPYFMIKILDNFYKI